MLHIRTLKTTRTQSYIVSWNQVHFANMILKRSYISSPTKEKKRTTTDEFNETNTCQINESCSAGSRTPVAMIQQTGPVASRTLNLKLNSAHTDESEQSSTTQCRNGQETMFLKRLSHEPKQSPLHGTGLFATRDIRAGETIISKEPLISFRNNPQGITNSLVEAVLDCFSRWSARESLKLWSIALRCDTFTDVTLDQFKNILKNPSRRNVEQLVNTIMRGGYAYYTAFGDTDWMIVDDQISVLNHSCTPNAELSLIGKMDGFFDSAEDALKESMVVTVKATKPIPAGTEITISYIASMHLEDKRRQMLDFDCQCSECSLLLGQLYFSEIWHKQLDSSLSHVEEFRKRHKMFKHRSALSDGVLRDLGGDPASGWIINNIENCLAATQAADMRSAILVFG